MADSGNKKKKKSYKVKSFKHEWLEKYLDGVKVKTWLTAAPDNPKKAKCMVCPSSADSPFSGRCFSIAEGFSAIKTHSETAVHKKASENPKQNAPLNQMRIETGIRNQEELTSKDRKEQENILHGQIVFSNMLHHHGAPSSLLACFAKQAHVLFPDSNIAKKWSSGGKSGFRSTKGDYFATHGIYPHQLQKLINILKTTFFLINFDETSLNDKSQLDINVSFMCEGEIIKENLVTIDMKGGSTAEEIVETVLGKLEEYGIPIENIIVVSFSPLYIHRG